jgi:hypothetical protein
LLALFIRNISIPGITMLVGEVIKVNVMAHQNIALVQLEAGYTDKCVGWS